MSMIGAFQARKGKMYYFLFFGKVAYESAFRVNPEDGRVPVVENRSPYQK